MGMIEFEEMSRVVINLDPDRLVGLYWKKIFSEDTHASTISFQQIF